MLTAPADFQRRRFRARLRRARPYLVAALVALLVATGVWLVYFSSLVTVEDVEVSGTSATLTSARVEKAAAVPMGEQLARVDLDAIRARVEGIDAVVSAEVSRSWPHGISITVLERVPIAVVSTGGKELALGADGIPFARKASQLPKGLPRVEAALDVNAATLAEAARVVLALRADIAARVQLVKAASVDNITLQLTGGVTVQWGSAAESENKAQVLAILLDKDVKEIDVSVPGRPTTR